LKAAVIFFVVRDTNERQAVHGGVPREFLQWIARGEVDSEKPVASLQGNSPVRASNETTVADAVLAMADSNSDVLEINSDRFITARDIRQTFGEDPLELLDTIAHAEDVAQSGTQHSRAKAGSQASQHGIFRRVASLGSRRVWTSAFSEGSWRTWHRSPWRGAGAFADLPEEENTSRIRASMLSSSEEIRITRSPAERHFNA
jgi:hypothetical protein